MAFRVSTYGQNLKTASYLKQNQDTLSMKGSQIAQGGKISDLFRDLGSSSGDALNLDMALSTIESFNTNIQVAEARLQTAEGALTKLADLAVQMRNQVIGSLTSESTYAQVAINLAPQQLEQVEDLLNASLAGTYLFGRGSGLPPADISLLPDPSLTDPPDYSYSLAGTTPFRAQISSAASYFEYSFGVDEPGFERLIRGLKLLSSAASNDTSLLRESLHALNDAIGKLGSLLGRIGHQQQQLMTTQAFNTHLYETTFSTYKKLGTVDQATTISEYQTSLDQLETTIKITRSLSKIGFFNEM